jgi:hypothetical protein
LTFPPIELAPFRRQGSKYERLRFEILGQALALHEGVITDRPLVRSALSHCRHCLLALSVAALVACGAEASPAPDTVTDVHAADEQAVYAAVLANGYGASFYVIDDHTMGFSLDDPESAAELDYVVSQMPDLSVQAVASFCVRNDGASALSGSLDLGAPYKLLSDIESKDIFSVGQDGWTRFHQKYPDAPGIIGLSRVGFNASGDQALMRWRFQTDWLAGDGGFVLLTKAAGVWQVVLKVVTLVS